MRNVEELLGRYFEGETSVQEEKWLKEYFRNTSQIPEQLEPYRNMFGYYDEQRRITSVHKEIRSRGNGKLRYIYLTLAAAASIALFFELRPTNEPSPEIAASTVTNAKVEQKPKVAEVGTPKAAAEEPVKKPMAKKMAKRTKKAAVKPASEPKVREAFTPIKEINVMEDKLKELATMREIDSSLSPLSSLAYLESYFTQKQVQDNQK